MFFVSATDDILPQAPEPLDSAVSWGSPIPALMVVPCPLYGGVPLLSSLRQRGALSMRRGSSGFDSAAEVKMKWFPRETLTARTTVSGSSSTDADKPGSLAGAVLCPERVRLRVSPESYRL